MKRSVFSLITAAILAAPSLASASTWNIDPSHGEVGFSVRHLMVSNTKGQFNKFEGTVDLNEKNITKSKVEVSIDAASIDTDDDKRDGHLKSPDFFNVQKYPKLTFKSTKITKAGKGYKVMGNLTIHGVTKPVTLNVEELTAPIKDPWGNTRRGLSAYTKINRKDFGLTWNKALETGGVVVGEEVKIRIDAELIKAK